MKKVYILITFIIAFIIGDLIRQKYMNSNISSTKKEQLRCNGLLEKTVSFNSTVIVESSFDSSIDSSIDIEEQKYRTVKEQLKFFFGQFHYQDLSNVKYYPLGPGEIRLLGSRTIEDGKQLVDYSFNTDIKICNTVKSVNKSNSLKFYLPKEPFNIYSSMDKKKFIDVSWRGKLRNVHPCVDKRYLDEDNSKHFWYFWKPTKVTDNINCLKELSINDSILSFQINLENKSKVKLTKPRVVLKDSLEISLIYGQVDYSLESVSKILSPLLRKDDFMSRFAFSSDGSKKLKKAVTERVDVSFLALLKLIGEIYSIDRQLRVEVEELNDSYVSMHLEFVLPRTKTKVELNLLQGNIYVNKKDSIYKSFYINAVENSDYVLFLSHSAHGGNAKLSNLKKNFGISDRLFSKMINKKDYQLFGYFQCYSSAYHAREVMRLRKREGVVTDVLYMPTEGFPFKGPLRLLRQFDDGELASFHTRFNIIGKNDLYVIDRIQ